MRIEYKYSVDERGFVVAEMGTAWNDDAGHEVITAGSLVMDEQTFKKLIRALKMKFPSYVPKRELPKDWNIIGFILRDVL